MWVLVAVSTAVTNKGALYVQTADAEILNGMIDVHANVNVAHIDGQMVDERNSIRCIHDDPDER